MLFNIGKKVRAAYFVRDVLRRSKRNVRRLRKRIGKDKQFLKKMEAMHFAKNKQKLISVKVSVIIPVYNGGTELLQLLEALKSQEGIKSLEVIVVDSGSTDDSVKLAKEHGAKVIPITQEQFSHSYARNLGADHAEGDYLLFMTQDACPTDRFWLWKLLLYLMYGKVAAVSCQETPRQDCDLFGRLSIWNYSDYQEILDRDNIKKMPLQESAVSLVKGGQLSDVACLIKKSLFMQYYYRFSYAEDLDLGIRLMRDGYSISMLSSVKVIHSHTRASFYFFRRAMVAEISMKKILPKKNYRASSVEDIMNCILTGFSVAKIYVFALDQYTVRGQGTGAWREFCAWTKRALNDGVRKVEGMEKDELKKLLEASDARFDPEFQGVMLQIYELQGQRFRVQISMVEELRHYLCSILTDYLSYTGEVFDSSRKEEICVLTGKLVGLFSGNRLGAYAAAHEKGKDSVCEMVRRYAKGI